MAATIRRATTRRLRGALAIGVAGAVIGLLSVGAPSRAPDFVWRGSSGATSPGPRASATLRAIARVLTVHYRLPLPSRLVARTYSTRDQFAGALVTHAFLGPERAARMATFAAGVALPGSLLLREAAEPTPDWIRLIAHELTHVSQIELAGGEKPAARWLGEGMAEWIAYGVLEQTRPGTLEAQRRYVRSAVCTQLSAGPIDLSALAESEAFVDRALREGAQPTYHLVFHLVDELISRAGTAAVRAYFDSFRESLDAATNFEAAFGMSIRDFEREVAREGAVLCARASQAAASRRRAVTPDLGITLPVPRTPIMPIQAPLVVS
jgi:hypothetical protein